MERSSFAPGISRRTFLATASLAVGSGVLAACVPAPAPSAGSEAQAPEVMTGKVADIVLRQIGTGVSGVNEIAEQAKADLGFTIQMTALGTDENNQRAITQPGSYDIFDGEYFSLPLVVPSGALQGLDVSRIEAFEKIAPTFTTGKLTEDSVIAQGTAPHKVMFLPERNSTSFAEGRLTRPPRGFPGPKSCVRDARPDCRAALPMPWRACSRAAYPGRR